MNLIQEILLQGYKVIIIIIYFYFTKYYKFSNIENHQFPY